MLVATNKNIYNNMQNKSSYSKTEHFLIFPNIFNKTSKSKINAKFFY